jgi:hypothetical protein
MLHFFHAFLMFYSVPNAKVSYNTINTHVIKALQQLALRKLTFTQYFTPTTFSANQLLHELAFRCVYTKKPLHHKHKTVYYSTGFPWPKSSRPLGQRPAA